MKWIAISGSWRKTSKEIEEQVRKTVREIIQKGDGIVSGGALNVDFFATDEAMKANESCDKMKICLPTTLEVYSNHYLKRADEGVITQKQAEDLISLLKYLKKKNPSAIIENEQNRVVNKDTYFERDQVVIQLSDELIAFQVNNSEGVQDTVEKAYAKGIPVKLYKFEIEE